MSALHHYFQHGTAAEGGAAGSGKNRSSQQQPRSSTRGTIQQQQRTATTTTADALDNQDSLDAGTASLISSTGLAQGDSISEECEAGAMCVRTYAPRLVTNAIFPLNFSKQ